jgi:hypothetical protein
MRASVGIGKGCGACFLEPRRRIERPFCLFSLISTFWIYQVGGGNLFSVFQDSLSPPLINVKTLYHALLSLVKRIFQKNEKKAKITKFFINSVTPGEIS